MLERELIIEELEPSDASALVSFLKAIKSETDLITWDETVVANQAEAQIFIDSQLQSLTSICLVAKLESEIIGLINIKETQGKGDLFIALLQAYRGHGIGSYLMETAIDWARETPRLTELVLSVQKRNHIARQLYLKYGFEITGEDSVLDDAGQVLPVCLMTKQV